MAVFNSSTDGLDLCISYLYLYYKFYLWNKVAVFNSSIHMLMALICGCASLWPLVVSCNQLAGGEGGRGGSIGGRKSGMLRSHSWIAATLRSDTLTAKLVAHSTPHVSRRGRQAGGQYTAL